MKLMAESGKRKTLLLMVTLFCFFITTCLAPPERAWALSLSDEKELGRKILEQVREMLPLIEDGEIVAYVQSVGNRIVRQVGTTPYQYQFFLVNESIPNAFAIPGGYIFVYRGLIELMATEDELASVLAHELAHIQGRHIHRRLEQGKVLSVAAVVGVLAAAFLGKGGDASRAIATGIAAGAKSLELKYSRENEEEADQLGFQYLCEAGYEPGDMVSAMERLSRGQWRGNSRVPSYLSTHPALSERVQYLQNMVSRHPGSKTSKPKRESTRGDFPFMRAALMAEYSDSQMALSRFEAESRRGGAAASYGMGRLHLRQGQLKDALPYLEEAAREYPTSPLVLSTLGSAYSQEGRFTEARKVLQAALALDPGATFVRFRLALVMKDMGKNTEALDHLQVIEEFAPTFPEIDYHLGVLLGQMNRLGQAHFHLGRYYQHRHDWSTALFHYEKSRALLKDSPRHVEEIDREVKEVREKRKTALLKTRR